MGRIPFLGTPSSVYQLRNRRSQTGGEVGARSNSLNRPTLEQYWQWLAMAG
jgi:hypothetical protein